MSDALSRYESVVDQQIRMAQERGDFDDLPGMGEPLPGWGSEDDENWWLKAYLRREGLPAEALPTSLQLAREVERIPEAVADLRSEQAVRDAVGALNERVAAYRRAPSAPYVRVAPVDADQVVAHWRAQWQHAPTAAPSTKEPRRFRRRRTPSTKEPWVRRFRLRRRTP